MSWLGGLGVQLRASISMAEGLQIQALESRVEGSPREAPVNTKDIILLEHQLFVAPSSLMLIELERKRALVKCGKEGPS